MGKEMPRAAQQCWAVFSYAANIIVMTLLIDKSRKMSCLISTLSYTFQSFIMHALHICLAVSL